MEKHTKLGGGFIFFLFSPLFGEDFQFDYIIFSDGLKPPPSNAFNQEDGLLAQTILLHQTHRST